MSGYDGPLVILILLATSGSGLTHLKKLKQLRLDCNNILKLDAAELCGCVQLTYLDVSHNRIESIYVSSKDLASVYGVDAW